MTERQTSWFTRFARRASIVAGRPVAFAVATLMLLVWGATGPVFGFSDTWQLVMNTITSIITFLMVFLIQNTQNRDSEAIQIKLDELIRATQGAHNALLDLEDLDEADLMRIRARYERLADSARRALERGGLDTGTKEGADALRDTRGGGRRRRQRRH